MFLVNSRQTPFTATSQSSFCEKNHPRRHSFSRSYGVILPSSLTKVLSSALGYSPRLPVSVLVRSLPRIRTEVFLGNPADHFRLQMVLSRYQGFRLRICLQPTSIPETGTINAPLTFQVPSPLHQLPESGARILTRCPSTTPFGLALGAD